MAVGGQGGGGEGVVSVVEMDLRLRDQEVCYCVAGGTTDVFLLVLLNTTAT